MTRASLLPRLPQAVPDERAPRRDKRARMLLWALLAAMATGFLGLGSPLDDYYRMLRNLARIHPPSGTIVAVKVDDRSLEGVGTWPWSRKTHADLVNALTKAGVKRVFYDVLFNAPGEGGQDKQFAGAMRAAGNVYLPATWNRDRVTGELRAKMPIPVLRESAAGLVSIGVNYSGLVAVREMPFQKLLGGQWLDTMSVKISGVKGPNNGTFPIDYSVDVDHIPAISAIDVLDHAPGTAKLKGKDVVIHAASREMGDLYYVPGRGQVNGGYVQILAAETLREGVPSNLGWLPLMLVGFVLSTITMYAPGRWVPRITTALAVLALTALPLFAEAHRIFLDVMPAILLTGIALGSRAWTNFRQSYRVRGDINAISGLPNLNALRSENVASEAVLVASRVRNFAEISSTLPPDSERALVDQIVARLALGARGARIYQGDEGIFVWHTAQEISGPDQLEALHALFRSPALVDGRPIDLAVTFGIDNGGDRTLANRIGATLVAADEAAAEGHRWKAYDPAKLADAEWKLSLLGRLDAAIDDGEVWVAYQPQLDLATGRICGAEALVRWSHPEKGEVSPQEFVLAAEQHDRIDKLTEFVLSDAIKAAAAFVARGMEFEVAVNISARLLERPGLVDLVRRLLADAQLAPHLLTLEVTESAALTSGRTSIRTLEEIGSLGINVSIDDYGTGFSTLDYFKRIPATEVKIDRSFVASIARNASDRVMVRSTIELAHSMGRTVVAEGVETDDILTELRKLGCDKAQGYLIGRPMKLMNLTRLLMEGAKSNAA